MKTVLLKTPILAVAAGLACATADAQLPTNFPAITVSAYDSNKVAEGYVFLTSFGLAPGAPSFLMILDNDGNVVDGDKYQQLALLGMDFKMQANGLLSYADALAGLPYGGGWDCNQRLVDASITNLVETFQMKNGYLAELHDFELLPNGHALMVGYYGTEIDLSGIVNGGHPAALVSGAIIQELDAQRNAVFQWRSWDAYDFETHTFANPGGAVQGSEFHVNNVNLDADGNLIVGTPAEIWKVNRQTGEVMWTLGGPNNEFTFIDGDVSHFGGHGTHRLPNGNLLMYDNSDGTITSRVHEYALDETNKVATRVWSYIPPAPIICRITGNAQRLPNGNTFICWGGFRSAGVPVCSEVTPAGEVVFELSYDDTALQSYRAYRFPYPPNEKIEHTNTELAEGNDYDFGSTGVNLDVQSLSTFGYNDVTVTRAPYAPLQPSFITKAPRALPLRVTVAQHGISSITADLSFDVASFGFNDPTNLTVYHRTTPGTGLFVALATTYNQGTGELQVPMTQFGEFIFCHPDLADVAHAPILNRPESYRGVQTNKVVAPRKVETNVVYTVNQDLPILLSWSPRGFARFYDLEVATDAAFTSLVANRIYINDAFHVLSNALPNTTYHWRARARVDDGTVTGDWSTNTFQTIAPTIAVTVPNGGELWTRGLDEFIQWTDNIAESVVIELYKGGVFVQTIATNPSSGAFQWEVDPALAPGSDYAIKISSVTSPALGDMSDGDFNIDVPEITRITKNPDDSVVLEWTGTATSVYVEFSTAPGGASWSTLAGPLSGNSWTNMSPPSATNGNYRLRLQ